MSKKKKNDLDIWDRQFLDDLYAMFDAINRCLDGLHDMSGVDLEVARFAGFDFHLVHEAKLGRHYPAGSFESHRPMLAQYNAQVSRWKRSADRNNLAKVDVIRICKAPFHAT
jgi:uncharacterized protein YfbU (UPF0304 family)